MSSHYDTLQVIPSASDAVIKAAYRVLAHAYHPDHNPGNVDAESLMKDVNHAYKILSNTSSRAQYDIQQGLRDYPNDVDDFAEPLETQADPNASTFTPQPATHQTQQPSAKTVFQNRAGFKPVNWPLRFIFFAAAGIFSLMAAAKWMVNADPNLTMGARPSEVQELKLQLDKNLLIAPEF
jgi:curved DNA-binding protein CbpA